MSKGKVSILYVDSGNGPDNFDMYLSHSLERMGYDVEMFDVCGNGQNGLPSGDVVLNRVYPSLSKGNGISEIAIDLSKKMESKGSRVINTSDSAVFDYDKFEAYQRMENVGIPTPKTFMFYDMDSALNVCELLGYPVIIKRNVGGKCNGVEMLKNPEDARKKMIKHIKNTKTYHGDIILQKFIKSQKDHDVRIAVFGGEPVLSYGRKLISTNSEEPWIGSVNLGSEVIDYSPEKEEIDVAVRASEALGSDINDVDICIGSEGPFVIENNLTPGYTKRKTASMMSEFVSRLFHEG